jgi:hypothetical protein
MLGNGDARPLASNRQGTGELKQNRMNPRYGGELFGLSDTRSTQAKDSPKKLKKQINGNFNNIGEAVENELNKCHCSNFFHVSGAEIQPKPVLDIFLRGFSLCSCPQHSLKAPLLLNPMRRLKYVLNCEHT